MRIAKGDEYLTAFRTRFRLHEYLVIPFGLANAPSPFQNYINDTLKGYLDEFCTAYIDDILIFSETLEEHETHVKKVLARLQDAGLQIDIKKCNFHVMPLTDLKKDAPFVWGSDQQRAFLKIKSEFKKNVVIQHFDRDKPTRLETDASDRGTGGVLLQPDVSGNWRPVAFFSKKMS
ncbi:hypothetical protein K3495_g8261 [Podosphaera aphanis]|nr:hypothetical protein K3495_g8261 [Podosphaera aphanis]